MQGEKISIKQAIASSKKKLFNAKGRYQLNNSAII